MMKLIWAAAAAGLLLAGCTAANDGNAEYRDAEAPGDAPLVKAIAEGDEDAIHTLLSAGVPLDATMGDGQTSALMMAVNKADAALVRRLLDAGAPIDQRDKRGDPALNYATYYGNEELVRIFVETGARKDLVGHGDAHDIALRFGREEVTQIIAPDPALPRLLKAAKAGDAQAMQATIGHGGDISSIDASGRNALHLAARSGNVDAVRTALDLGIAVDSLNKVEFTPLIMAARAGHEDVTALLLERGANVNHVASKRALHMRALFMAAINGHTKVVDMLLDAGADINARDTDGGNAFSWAVGEGQPDMAIHLLEQGSDLSDLATPNEILGFVEGMGNEALAAAVRAKVQD